MSRKRKAQGDIPSGSHACLQKHKRHKTESKDRQYVALFDADKQPFVPCSSKCKLCADVATFVYEEDNHIPRYEGRTTGSRGSALAQAFIARKFREAKLQSFAAEQTFVQDFAIRPDDETRSLSAKNLIGYHKGSQDSDKVILITAHYDHMGKDGAKVYHGADDNASGVGALIALATHFAAIRPQHTLIFAALDAEEWGFRGAEEFVKRPPLTFVDMKATSADHKVPVSTSGRRSECVLDTSRTYTLALNINLDMLSHNFNNVLQVTGLTKSPAKGLDGPHYPFLKAPLLEALQGSSVSLVEDNGQDCMLADHCVFHEDWQCPFLFFGVDFHKDYHKPTDTFERTNPEFLTRVCEMLGGVVTAFDANLEATIDATRKHKAAHH